MLLFEQGVLVTESRANAGERTDRQNKRVERERENDILLCVFITPLKMHSDKRNHEILLAPSMKETSRFTEHVSSKLTFVISSRRIVHHEEKSTIAHTAHTHTDKFRAFPNDLREV